MRRKPKLEKIAAHLAPVKELARDIVFTFKNERWNVKIHRDLYEDIVGAEGVPDTATDWIVYSDDNSNVGRPITRHVESVEAIDTKVVENLPPETPEPSAKVVEDSIPVTGGKVITNHLPETVRNGPKTVESSIPDTGRVLPSRHLPGTEENGPGTVKSSLPDTDGIPIKGHLPGTQKNGSRTEKNPGAPSLDRVATLVPGNDQGEKEINKNNVTSVSTGSVDEGVRKKKKEKEPSDVKRVNSSLYAAVDETTDDTSPQTTRRLPKEIKDDFVSLRQHKEKQANNYYDPKRDPTPQIKH